MATISALKRALPKTEAGLEKKLKELATAETTLENGVLYARCSVALYTILVNKGHEFLKALYQPRLEGWQKRLDYITAKYNNELPLFA